MNCKLCHNDELEIAYDGAIRSGGVNSEKEKGYSILKCNNCSVEFLNPFPSDLDKYYESEDYWNVHKEGEEIEAIQKKLDPEQFLWSTHIGISQFRNKNIVDFGCGSGLFLDLVKGVAHETYGVDLAIHFKNHLFANGHKFIQYSKNITLENMDIAVSFDTLEHSNDPINFLKDVYNSLKKCGKLFLGVPNQHDFLKTIVPQYLPFFYHKSHLFYFSKDSLERLFEQVGFKNINVKFVHKYDITNMLVWAKEGVGQGKKGSDLFDKFMEGSFKENLERLGIASHILVEAIK